MSFLSLPYAVFLPVVVGLFWTLRDRRWRLLVLLLASLAFFGINQPLYVPLLLLGMLTNFWLGLAIGIPPDVRIVHFHRNRWGGERQAKRRRILLLGITFNVLLLFGFKYVPFVLNSLGWGLRDPALLDAASWVSQSIAAPLGLSFFAFECIAYLVDIYRGAPPAEDLLTFATYKLFFPKLISGPIVRYHTLLGKLRTLHRQRFILPEQLAEGLWLIACGAVKKGLIADYTGLWVNLSLGNLERASSGDLWLAMAGYSIQIYLDFSGYVDVARGSALLLGIELPHNFDFPYLTTSIAEFWRRWHMTLGDWLRNYLYFPLGGSRRGLWRTCLNLFLVMFLGGLWHGAAWGFIVWGIIHGAALAIHRLTEAQSQRFPWLRAFWQTPPGLLLGWGLTQGTVFLGWIFFRLPDLAVSGTVVRHLWGRSADAQFTQKVYGEGLGLDPLQLWASLAAIAIAMALLAVLHRGLRLQLNWPLKLLLVPPSLLGVWIFAPEGIPFIYFDF